MVFFKKGQERIKMTLKVCKTVGRYQLRPALGSPLTAAATVAPLYFRATNEAHKQNDDRQKIKHQDGQQGTDS